MAEVRPWVRVRGLYGGAPDALKAEPGGLAAAGINAVWIGSGSLTAERVSQLNDAGARVFAEFNTLHVAEYLTDHPDAAPVGPDGEVSPAPDGWQGICPTHRDYRKDRLAAFATAVTEYAIDGIWLDYHHAHASWEQAEPNLPDTCFCRRCLGQFTARTGIALPAQIPLASAKLLGDLNREWVDFRCSVLTDWVAEFRRILDRARPGALLGTFHCPWSAAERDGALRKKLFIDLRAQMQYVDVLSPMPYHARFGHGDDPEWPARQAAWLGETLGITGAEGERVKIWPIVQASDWGEAVPLEQIPLVLEAATRRPATGVTVFAWGGLSEAPEKVEAIRTFYQEISPTPPAPTPDETTQE